jgi:hypothetical protein
MFEYFKAIILFMLFFSFATTTYTYALPADALHYTEVFSDNSVNFVDTAAEFENSLTSQTNVPLIEIGALVFYTGNYFIDLLLNFVFALPNAFTMVLSAIGALFGFDTFIWAYLDLFAKTAAIIFYFLGLMQFLNNVRSGRAI